MNVSLRWLLEFADIPNDPVDVAEALHRMGHEVEGVEHVKADFTGVIVVEVTGVAPHPNADKLRVITVDTGAGPHTVVCGAWNFDVGDTVVLCRVGSVLAGGFEVGDREIRGVSSPGMICSERELGLGDDHTGILVLPTGYAPLGTDFAETLPYPDVVFDVSITPNRPDAMSIHGIARDLAAYYEVDVHADVPEVAVTGPATAAVVRIEAPDGCPRFTGREIRDALLKPSPLWMRLRLRNAGQRPISNVVDITNYVMLEFGQPLHAFDLDKVPDETLIVRTAADGERLTTLDSVDRLLDPRDLVISGVDQALALAGVMGGEHSEIGDDTTRVLLEVAHFEPNGLLLTGKRHGLRSEAVARFERGVDPNLPPLASARASALLAELADGVVCEGFIDEYPTPIEPWTIELPTGEAERLIGVPFSPVQVTDLLTRLGCGVEGDGPFTVTVPTYRPDVTRPADLVEEIARLHGYDQVPETLPHGPGLGLPRRDQVRRAVSRAMIGAGYSEIMSFSFLGEEDVAAFGYPEDDRRGSPVPVRNPLNEEQHLLRPSLLPGLLRAIRANTGRNLDDVFVFEIGRVFLPGSDEIPDQPVRLAFAARGRLEGPSWGVRAEVDAGDATGVWETVAAALGVPLRVEQSEAPGFHPGRCATVFVDGVAVGSVGEVHPRVAEVFEIDGRVAAGEIDLERLLERSGYAGFTVPSTFPPVVFDLAFDVRGDVAAADLREAVAAHAGPELERLVLFDVFSGPPLEEGRKSMAFRLTFRHPERTLTDEELEPVRRSISDHVTITLDGRLRGG